MLQTSGMPSVFEGVYECTMCFHQNKDGNTLICQSFFFLLQFLKTINSRLLVVDEGGLGGVGITEKLGHFPLVIRRIKYQSTSTLVRWKNADVFLQEGSFDGGGVALERAAETLSLRCAASETTPHLGG